MDPEWLAQQTKHQTPDSDTDVEVMSEADYLLDLAARISRIPVMHGVDQYDFDRLRWLAIKIAKLEKEA